MFIVYYTLMSLRKHFENYAAKNYLPEDLILLSDSYPLNASTNLNSVPGDKVDSVFSPLRTRFYSAFARFLGTVGVLATSVPNFIAYIEGDNVDPAKTVMSVGSAALVSVSHYVCKTAENGMRDGLINK